MQSMVGSLATIVGRCIQALICCVLCVCSGFHCLGQYPYRLIIDILSRCFPLIIMLDWQCTVGSLVRISSAVSRLFKVFCPCFYTLLVMHTSLCHVVLHSGTHQLCFVFVFGTDSQQLHIHARFNVPTRFSTMQTYVFVPNFRVT